MYDGRWKKDEWDRDRAKEYVKMGETLPAMTFLKQFS